MKIIATKKTLIYIKSECLTIRDCMNCALWLFCRDTLSESFSNCIVSDGISIHPDIIPMDIASKQCDVCCTFISTGRKINKTIKVNPSCTKNIYITEMNDEEREYFTDICFQNGFGCSSCALIQVCNGNIIKQEALSKDRLESILILNNGG